MLGSPPRGERVEGGRRPAAAVSQPIRQFGCLRQLRRLPVAPVVPVDPADPADPVHPVTPVDPVDPVDRVDLAENSRRLEFVRRHGT